MVLHNQDGKFEEIPDFETCIKGIEFWNKSLQNQIDIQNKQLSRLESEHYKDELVSELQTQVNNLRDEHRHGFPISELEYKEMKQWEENHIREKHWDSKNNCPMGCGAIGGRYNYIFTPTGIGTIGTVRCSCGDEFCFSDL